MGTHFTHFTKENHGKGNHSEVGRVSGFWDNLPCVLSIVLNSLNLNHKNKHCIAVMCSTWCDCLGINPSFALDLFR